MEIDSYIIMKRSNATKLVRLISWLIVLLSTAGPSWHRHIQDMHVARADLEDAIALSERASKQARHVA